MSQFVPQQPLPTKVGEEFVVDDFNNKVTPNDLGSNYFGGNAGPSESTAGLTAIDLSPDSHGSPGNSLQISFDFTGQPVAGTFAGHFQSLWGGSAVPGYFIDTENFFGDYLPLSNRSLDFLTFDTRLVTNTPLTVKVELKDEQNLTASTTFVVPNTTWKTVSLEIPTGFVPQPGFNFREVSILSFLVEAPNVGGGAGNPTNGTFLVDNIRLVDADGVYPDMDAARGPDDTLLPQFTDSFLDQVRASSFLYFTDFASPDPRSGGIIQDRSTFADVLSVGGAGFQLTAYSIGAERGYITRDDAALRTRNILRALHDGPQGPAPAGTIGHQGFFYHFLGTDGLRRQRVDDPNTPGVDESRDTVELSTTDTALAIMGALTAQQYFTEDTPLENEIRALSDAIYRRVNWTFMLNPIRNQFYLGWKPIELRDGDPFEVPDGNNEGQFSGTLGAPQTFDFYTDEAVLISLLAIASPEPSHRVDPSVFFSTVRDNAGGDFFRTFPGSLFTYQFASAWLNTQALGSDFDPRLITNPALAAPRQDYFTNTRRAILETRDYTLANPNNRATWEGEGASQRWGLSAAEGPYDRYFAWAAPTAALTQDRGCGDPDQCPLELGTVTVYGVGSSITHTPEEAIAGLGEAQRLGLLHPRIGFADAYNLDIADALDAEVQGQTFLRTQGPWANFTGFAIDHGPMLIHIDNYLSDQFIPGLVMSQPDLRQALDQLFPDQNAGRIEGTLFVDVNANGLPDAGESGIPGQTIVLDRNGNGVRDDEDLTTTTDAAGRYVFASLPLATYRLLASPASSFAYTTATDTIELTGTNLLALEQDLGGQTVTPAINPTYPNPNLFVSPVTGLDANVRYVQALYRSILGREADDIGLATWVGLLPNPNAVPPLTHQRARLRVAQSIWESFEHRGTQINRYYLDLLGRLPDPAGASFWFNNLFFGAMTEEGVVAGILSSAEYQSRFADDAESVDGLFANVLGLIDPADTTLTFNAGPFDPLVQLQTGAASREAVILDVLYSDQTVLRGIDGIYQASLLRNPGSADEQAFWLSLVRGSGSIGDAFVGVLGSTEYLDNATT